MPLPRARAHEFGYWGAILAAANAVRLDDILQAAFRKSLRLRGLPSARRLQRPLGGPALPVRLVATGHSCRLEGEIQFAYHAN